MVVASVTENRYGFCFVFDEQGRVLVIKRSLTARYRPNEWDLPGGVLEPKEAVEVGVAREVLEETGLEVSALEHVTDGGGVWRGESHTFYYYRANSSSGKVRLSYEHSEFEWHEPLVAATMVRYRPHTYGFAEANKLLMSVNMR